MKSKSPKPRKRSKKALADTTSSDLPHDSITWQNALLQRLENCDAHHRLIIAAAVALLVALATMGSMRVPVQVVVVWDSFCVCLLLLAWFRMTTADALKCVRSAKLQDSSRTLIFFFVVAAACVSLFAVAYLMGTAKELPKDQAAGHALLALMTVAASWLLIHTMFALRYAHAFYGDAQDPSVKSWAGGLEFPEEKNPGYLDFAYFAFVIGMTCQVSDVQITDRGMRVQALLHGLLSFAFNTIILALSINTFSGLFAS